MKRLTLLTLALISAVALFAQADGLKIAQLFGGKYVSNPNVSQTILSGENAFLSRYNLTSFATFRGPAETFAKVVAPLVIADGAKAESRNIKYKDGRLSYAFFALPPVNAESKDNRYIYYIDPVGSKGKDIMLVYFDGKINGTKASRLISTIATPRRK